MPGKKVLVADDDFGIVDVMRIVLEDEGFEVITTMNGKNILKYCEQRPDVIFLDLWMSGVDGNVICKEIKASGNFKHIPVIIFSAHKNIKQISMDCSADGFLSKPFELSELLSMAHKYSTSV